MSRPGLIDTVSALSREEFSRRLAVIVAAAAPLPDRVAAGTSASAFVVADVPDRGELGTLVAAWLDRAAAEPGAKAALIDQLAGAGRPLGDGLRPVELRDASVLPPWATALEAFLSAQPPVPDRDTYAAGAPYDAFRRAASRLLPYRDGAILGVPVAADAWADLAGVLAHRLFEVCNLSFCHEMQTTTGSASDLDWAHWVGLDVSQLGWLDRFDALPGLGFVIGTVCLQWQQVFTEMLVRLDADRQLLRDRLWNGVDPGPLTALRGDAGDRHANGRSVALLTFANGCGVAYKPKDMRHATAYMQLIEFLNGRGMSLQLATRTILERTDDAGDGHDAYGWEELIQAVACPDRAGFGRYYRRLGMLIRLAQLLEGRDLWSDNLLAAGEYPHLIDLECLLYPRVQPPPSVPAGQHALLDVLESTVVRTAMAVQPWVPSKDRPVVDIGCLSRVGDLVDSDGNRVLPLPPYRPTTPDGSTADPWAYADEVVSGYREMHAVLVDAHPDLTSATGPLRGFEDVWVRYIWRHTWDGYKFIRASVSPRALVDGATRESVMAGALRGVLTALVDRKDRVDLLEVVLAEIESFRVLDIPMFRSRTTSSSVFTVDDREIPGHFQSTAWQRLHDRVAELTTFDLEAQVGVLTGCIDAARGGTATRSPAVPGVRLVPSSSELLRQAVRTGDTLLAARHTTETGSGWLGVSWYPLTGLRQVETAGIDLISGTGGVAMFLSELWAATGEPRFFKVAHDTLNATADFVGSSLGFVTDTRMASGVPVLGGLAGPGALIHALAHGSELLGDRQLLVRAQALVAPVMSLAVHPGGFADLPGGTAGLLANLLRLRRTSGPGHPATDDAITRLADLVVAQLAGPTARYARAEQFCDLVPVGADSVAMVLRRAVAEVPELLQVGAVESALGEHRFDLSTRGGRLAAGAAPAATPEPTALTCRELVATAGETLSAGNATNAAPLLAELLHRRERTGHWYGDRGIADGINIGALDGIAAVGLLLLRSLDPNTASLAVIN
jgi:lantibiotic modifying enzyme